MPHLIVEYSSNLEERINLDGLMAKLRDRAVASGVFPLGGIRVRGERRDRYLVADGAPDNGFVHLTARIGHGRDEETRREAAQALFDVLTRHMQTIFEERGLGLSFEMVEVDPVTSLKKNNLHERLGGVGSGAAAKNTRSATSRAPAG
ncbi:MAG: 5-carboxymethyl-2-hydroxymuconate Delta-isomerase [Gammaproteobacteria bacterium]|nr:5-carboxymethyl-2-hydroxymuconate Delta-isomerase [Gammaproteobacteria bacterium]MDE0367132.1 5-carboxymethyl-2-hydroxymuconate Delta-isomerase [Gammaproteobacteria bacterium]